MTSQVLLASRNAKKLAEMQRILAEHVPGIEVLGLDDVAAYDEPAETEPTFEGNALLKARAAVAATGLPSLADDSGLCVDALNGMPGVLSARWAGSRRKDDAANNALLLDQLADVPDERRGAHFRCAVGVSLPAPTAWPSTSSTADARAGDPRDCGAAAASATTCCSCPTATTPHHGRADAPRRRTRSPTAARRSARSRRWSPPRSLDGTAVRTAVAGAPGEIRTHTGHGPKPCASAIGLRARRPVLGAARQELLRRRGRGAAWRRGRWP